MTQLPEEDVDQLWVQLGENKDWTSFMKTVMRQCGKRPSLDSLMVDYLVREAYDLNKAKTEFPETPNMLYQVLADRMRTFTL